MSGRDAILSNLLGLVGGAIGATLGYFIFSWFVGQGFYGMMIPGALLGLGCGLLARHPSTARGVICGVVALGLSLFVEWKFFPFIADGSFPYLLTHVHQLNGVHLLMILAGVFFAYWLGKDAGIAGLSARRASKPPRP